MSKHWRKPSPGLIVATVALVMAMGGVGYAAGGSDTKSDKKVANKAAKSYFNSHIAGATVSRANSANFAGAAVSANPVAFAHVSAAGAIDAGTSKNAGTVTLSGSNHYCFSGLPFTPRGGQATVDFNDAGVEFAQFGLGVGAGCPAGTQAFVGTETNSGASAAGFFVSFYG